MQDRLSELAFYPDSQGQSICSYNYKSIAVDIMLADDNSLGATNRWYKPGFDFLEQTTLPDGIDIAILSAPYFLATKIEAFNNRGNVDFYGSHDFEDIIYLLDNRTNLIEEILKSDELVQKFIKVELTKIKNHPQANEILAMHIHPLIREERFSLLMEKLNAIIE